jgi:broad specificity phosphatase PhoE
MSTLTLVRHGQARTYQDAADQLSPVGESQARMLGEFWTRHRRNFDAVYCGSLVRQWQTAELVGERYRSNGLSWPEHRVLEELNEYDVRGILGNLLPDLAAEDMRVQRLVDAYKGSRAGPDRNREFQRMFEAVMIRWLEGKGRGVEAWLDFRDRVRRGMRRMMEDAGSGMRIVAFTSGGPIGAAVQFALGAPDRAALEVNWRVRNSSLTEFVFTRDRFTLDMFNAVPHLDDPDLLTYR